MHRKFISAMGHDPGLIPWRVLSRPCDKQGGEHKPGATVAVGEKSDEQEWTAETRTLAACLEALLQAVRGAGPAAANDQAADQGSGSCAQPSSRIAPDFQQE